MTQKTGDELLVEMDAEEEVWVRFGAILSDYQDDWSLIVLDITTGVAPPDWEFIYWRYARAILWAETLPGSSVTNWIRSHSISVGDDAIAIPEVQLAQLHTVRRRSSGSLGAHGRFDWPYSEWTLSLEGTIGNSFTDELIGDGSVPPFIRPDIAVAAMLRMDLPPGGSFSAGSLILRQQNQTARIRGVHIFPTKVEVQIDGNGLPGSIVELASNQPGPTQIITDHGQQSVELPTPAGLPSVPWIVIKKDGEWLDQRFLDPVYSQAQANDVDYWVDPSERLEALISGGEGPTTEFKREVPEDTIRIMKSVAAFSNGAGGTILVRVENDGSIVGVSDTVSNEDGLDTLTNKIRSWISPLPDFELQTIETGEDRLPVVAIFVQKGPLPPYGAGTTDDTIKYYVRRGATSFVVVSGSGARACPCHTLRRAFFLSRQLLQVGTTDVRRRQSYAAW